MRRIKTRTNNHIKKKKQKKKIFNLINLENADYMYGVKKLYFKKLKD